MRASQYTKASKERREKKVEMAKKTTKKRNLIPMVRKEVEPIPRQWPNLPHQLIDLIARQPTLMQNITSYGCVTKSWRSSSPSKCSSDGKPRQPQLVIIAGKRQGASGPHNYTNYHTVDISFHCETFCWYDKKKVRSYRYKASPVRFIGHSHGYIVAVETKLFECCLWKPSSDIFGPRRWRYGCFLPPWDKKLPFRLATLSSKPDDPYGCNVMVLTGISCPAFAFYRLTGGRLIETAWILEDSTLKDPFALNQPMQFTNAIGFEGKFYALSLQGSLVVIEDIDSCFRITAISTTCRTMPSKLSRQFREYLVESDGEILLVFLISRKSINHVEDVEVYRLDVLKLLWVKLKSLGGRTLFLEDECCMGVTASKVGCRGNCIYFTHHRVNEWFLYDMETTQISSGATSCDINKAMKWNELIEQEV